MKEVNLVIDEECLKELRRQAQKTFPNQEVGLLLNDPSCCGGIVHIDLMPISEIRQFSDVIEVFPKSYKNYGITIYIDKATMEDPIPNMRIVLVSKNPVKYSLENDDFYNK
jgi:hypothetical protein